jgi:hypothetical protein
MMPKMSCPQRVAADAVAVDVPLLVAMFNP